MRAHPRRPVPRRRHRPPDAAQLPAARHPRHRPGRRLAHRARHGERGGDHARADRPLAALRPRHPDRHARRGQPDADDVGGDVRGLLPGADRLAPLVPPQPRRRGRDPGLQARLAGGARRRPPAHRQPHRPRAGPVGRLLRHARRRRRHPHLARAAGADGGQSRGVGGRLRRAGRGGLRGAADRPAQRAEHHAAPGHAAGAAGGGHDLELASPLSWAA
ncbi:hypothetical protein SGPA1_50528 [Streptomyces misionensis JCM 4497]